MPIASIITPLPKMHQLQTTWRYLHGAAWAIAVLALCITLALQDLLPGNPGNTLLILASIFIAALAVLAGRWYADCLYARYYGEHHVGYGIMLRSGVWWHKEIWVPLARLQHIDVDQGPLDRRWGMATLTLYTAGTHENEIRIKGLPVADAHALRQALLPTERSAHE